MRYPTWTAGRAVSALRRLLLVTGSIVVVLLVNALSVAVGTALGLANFRDVGYADSAAVLIIDEFVRSGYLCPAPDDLLLL